METDSLVEIWKWIPGFVGEYSVSNRGRVCSFYSRNVGKGNGQGGWVLCGIPTLLTPKAIVQSPNVKRHYQQGYLRVGLSKNGYQHRKFVHDLVLLAFVGPAPVGCEALHLDDISSHNWLSNLRWGTRLENNRMKNSGV